MSIQPVEMLTEGDARRLTERIRLTAMSIRDGVEKLQRLVSEAQAGSAHLVLGYASWTAYLADVFGDEPLRLPRDERREVVAWLSGEGMSTRAIAPIVGAHHSTVAEDIAAVGNPTPAPAHPEYFETAEEETEVLALADMDEGDFEEALTTARTDGDLSRASVIAHAPQPPTIATPSGVIIAEQHRVDATTGEILDDTPPQPSPTKITGLDGKEYSRPEPATTKPRRRSIIDDAYAANRELFRIIERIRDIRNDDRYARNKADIHTALQPGADLALEVLTDLATHQ